MSKSNFICVVLLASALLGDGQDMFPIKTSPGVSDGQQIFDTNHVLSGDFSTRQLWSTDGSTPLVDWSSGNTVSLGGLLTVDVNGNAITFNTATTFDGDLLDSGTAVIGTNGGDGWKWQSGDGSTYFDNTGFHGDGSGLTNLPSSGTIFVGKNAFGQHQVANTTTETTVIGNDTVVAGSLTLPSNAGDDGKIFHVTASGQYSTKSSTVGNLTIYFKFNGSNVASIVVSNLPSSVSNQAFKFEYLIVQVGATSATLSTKLTFYTGSGAVLQYMDISPGLYIPGGLPVDVQAKWATADTLNSIQPYLGLID